MLIQHLNMLFRNSLYTRGYLSLWCAVHLLISSPLQLSPTISRVIWHHLPEDAVHPSCYSSSHRGSGPMSLSQGTNMHGKTQQPFQHHHINPHQLACRTNSDCNLTDPDCFCNSNNIAEATCCGITLCSDPNLALDFLSKSCNIDYVEAPSKDNCDSTVKIVTGRPAKETTSFVPEDDHTRRNPGLAVGLGVGIPLFCLVLAFLAFLVREGVRKERQRCRSGESARVNGSVVMSGAIVDDEEKGDVRLPPPASTLPLSTRPATTTTRPAHTRPAHTQPATTRPATTTTRPAPTRPAPTPPPPTPPPHTLPRSSPPPPDRSPTPYHRPHTQSSSTPLLFGSSTSNTVGDITQVLSTRGITRHEGNRSIPPYPEDNVMTAMPGRNFARSNRSVLDMPNPNNLTQPPSSSQRETATVPVAGSNENRGSNGFEGDRSSKRYSWSYWRRAFGEAASRAYWHD